MAESTQPDPPPPRKPSKPPVRRWPSPTFARGYVADRHGYAVLRFSQLSKATGLRFTPENRAAALKLLDAWLPGAISGEPVAKPAATTVRTVADLLNEYLTLYAAGMTANVKVSHRLAVRLFFPPSLPVVPLDVEAIADRIDRISESATIARSTLANRRTYIKAFLDFAVRRRYLATNPATLARKVERTPHTGAAVLTGQQVGIICWWFQCRDMEERQKINAARMHPDHWSRYALLWKLLYYTGMRIGEALRLKWSDYDEAAGLLTIDGKRVRSATPKLRAFPVAAFPEVAEVLAELRRIRSPQGYILPFIRRSEVSAEHLAECIEALGWGEKADPRARANGTKPRQGVQVRQPFPPKALRASAKFRWEHELGLSPRTSADLCGHTMEVAQTNYRPDIEGARLAGTIAKELAR